MKKFDLLLLFSFVNHSLKAFSKGKAKEVTERIKERYYTTILIQF